MDKERYDRVKRIMEKNHQKEMLRRIHEQKEKEEESKIEQKLDSIERDIDSKISKTLHVL